jgi:hypothetical protein
MKKNNIVDDTKKEIVNNILNSQTLKYTKYILLSLGAIYGLGYVFKILAFTKANLNTFRQTLKS